MSSFVVSIVRTYVPILIGGALSWLAVEHGIVVDESIQNEATVVVTGVVIALYYGLIRLIETRWPNIGVLLGRRTQPSYPPAPTPVV